MKRSFPFYPVLIGIFPILSVFSANQAFVPISELWRPLIVGSGLSFGLWLLLSAVFKSLEKGAAFAAVLIVSIYSYKTVLGYLPLDGGSLTTTIGWFLAALVLGYFAARKWRWHKPLLLFSMALVAIPSFSIAWTAFRSENIRQVSVENSGAKAVTIETKPDIVYIILDGYGRSDVLADQYGYSNKEFIEGLRSRGFYVADRSRANYCQTELSIGSSLNADFIQNILAELPDVKADNRRTLRYLLSDNAVFARLKRADYQVSKIETGFLATQQMKVDWTMRKKEGLGLLETTILQMTPLGFRPQFLTNLQAVRRAMLLQAFTDIGSLGGQSSRPRFTFAHILAPHPPFSFDATGGPVKLKGPFGYWDGSDYLTFANSADFYRKGYAGQAEFISKKMLAAVDSILVKDGPKPIIIIQGDHGPKVKLNQSSLEKTDPTECFPILNAMLVPEEVQSELYPEITPVNTFRTLFRVLFGDQMPNLEDKSWYSPYNVPFEFTDVTARLK